MMIDTPVTARNSLMTNSSRRLIAFCVALYLVLTAILVVSILVKTGGHFVYALDDPYIHLALAENLAKGHYGINSTEFSSPSSSLLWPFLLIPFAGTSVHVFVPLAWNILFGSLAAWVIGSAVDKWRINGRVCEPTPCWQQFVVASFLILVANLASLSIVGMEHVLQVLLSICCAYGAIEALQRRPVPGWCIAAAIIAPAVRYEDLSLTLAIACVLLGTKRWKAAILVFGLSVIPLIAFSVFLKSDGLPLLPLSVLVKGNAFAHSSAVAKVVFLVISSLREDLTRPEHYSTLALSLYLLILTFRSRVWLHRWVYGGATLLGFLQLTIGRFGWFHRYEVYALIFLLMISLSVIVEYPRLRFIYIGLGLLLCASFYIAGTIVTPGSSHAIYLQQYQMHRFVREYYEGDYAVNDLGLTSFQRRSGVYVLDVYGLASAEAARQHIKTAPWLQSIVERHDIDLAILYPEWFEIPESWKPVGKMCAETHEHNHLAEKCVVFYSTNSRSDQIIDSDLTQFAKTLPNQALYTRF
jgi:hypothetical protein